MHFEVKESLLFHIIIVNIFKESWTSHLVLEHACAFEQWFMAFDKEWLHVIDVYIGVH